MEQESKKTKIKFYIEDNTYYLYGIFINNNGNYLYAPRDSSEIKTNIKVENVGEILTEFLNTDFSFMYDIIEIFFKKDSTNNINQLFNNLFMELQSRLNYIFAVLILNKLFDYLDISCVPSFSDKLLETFNKKLNIISSYINVKKINNTFNFQYLKDIDMDNFKDDDIVPDIATKFETLMKFICDEHKLDKLFFECLVNNDDLNILDLTLSDSIKNIEYEILPSLKVDCKNHLIEIYSIDDLNTFLYFEMLQIQNNNSLLRICKNCKNYFIPNDPRQIYCSKSCNTKHFDNNLKENPVEKLYRITYKSQNKKKNQYINSRNNIENNWNTYKLELKNQKEKCKNNEISIENFKAWIDRNTDWFLKNNYIPK